MFSELCKGMGSEFEVLLYHSKFGVCAVGRC